MTNVERTIQQIYTQVFNKVFSKSRVRALQNGNRMGIVEAISKLQSSEDYEKFARKFARELSKKGIAHQRGIWRKYYNAARKLHYVSLPATFNEYEMSSIALAVRQNYTMIKTIPQEIMKLMEHKYVSTLIEEVQKGSLPRGSFRRQLEEHGHKNAKVIARTESAKLQTVILENRATSLGSVAYIWLSSNDRRTRPSHKMMNGVVVFWKHEKPHLDNMIGHAGEFPNCRCSPQPIMDDLDLDKTHYRVYDYRTNNIVGMSKNALLEKIEKGSLD